jgi:pimeloyl-ACP methyl ester carboxylesterase
MTKYWISVRAVSGGAFSNDIDVGGTRYLEVPDGETPSPRHAVSMSQWTKDVIASFPKRPPRPNAAPIPTGDVAFLVHGYNNGVEDVDRAQHLVQGALAENGFPCQVICFDWPSGQTAIAYLRDLDHARLTAIRLVNAGVKLFVAALLKDCNIRVHVLGHSMGAFVIREAFDHADDGATTQTNWTANQLVLFSGDVDAASFSANDPETESTYRHCYRLTNYFNGHDQILQISNVKRIGLEARVGRVGLPMDAPYKAVDVDCSDYFERTYGVQLEANPDPVFTHSWYFTDPMFMKDLAITLRGAVDREKISTRGPGPGRTQILDGEKAQIAVVNSRTVAPS